MKSYNFSKDLKTIREVFGLTQDEFATQLGISRSNIIRYENDEIKPRKNVLEIVYSFAYNNDLFISKAKEMLYLDEKGENVLLFHGAKSPIDGDIDSTHLEGLKDFGAGFYLGESLDSAISWVADRESGSCYCFYFLKDKDYKVLHFDVNREWMYAILYFRGAFKKFIPSQEVLDIINRINTCDYLIAPIANNNMYDTLNSFMYGDITDEQCLHALSANNLGYQYVFKSQRACDALKFVDQLYLCENQKKRYLLTKKELAMQGRSKTSLAINEYRRKGQYFDELFKKNG